MHGPDAHDANRARSVELEIPGAPARRSTITVGLGLLGDLASFGDALAGARRALVVRDTGVSDDDTDRLVRTLGTLGLSVSVHAVTPSERDKSLSSLGEILGAALEAGLERSDALVALGGGIVGDLAGYAGASYLRGVRVVQCPTTLLAMVDASVGGKTGVNLTGPDGALYKNMAGAFWQPGRVVVDIDTLRTLPDRERRCGLAECLKHGLLSADHGDPELFADTRDALPTLWSSAEGGRPDTLTSLVVRNIRVKAAVVRADERETDRSGGRALLNLGHTFGHAIETIPTLSPSGAGADAPLHHGEAVALGVVAACQAGVSASLLDPVVGDRVTEVIFASGLPISVAGLPPTGEIVERMTRDKKSSAGRIRLVLPVGDQPGRVRLVDDVDPAWIEAGIEAIRA